MATNDDPAIGISYRRIISNALVVKIHNGLTEQVAEGLVCLTMGESKKSLKNRQNLPTLEVVHRRCTQHRATLNALRDQRERVVSEYMGAVSMWAVRMGSEALASSTPDQAFRAAKTLIEARKLLNALHTAPPATTGKAGMPAAPLTGGIDPQTDLRGV